jgi:tRNA pseudouridine38-40 synthase
MKYRYFVILQYNGKNYYGWQIQPNVPTVQSELNNKLSLILKENIHTIGAGRTDTGVHARFFTAHFDLEQDINHKIIDVIYKINRFLPPDIRILKIVPVEIKAHARYDAISRTYNYYISNNKEIFNHDLVWEKLFRPDIVLMNQGADILKEYEDFTSFSKLHSDVKTNICHINEAYWIYDNDLLIFSITADRFLRNMVRAIVGTLLLLGQHKINIIQLRKIIESKNRSKAGESVPAKGLFLEKIEYPFPL